LSPPALSDVEAMTQPEICRLRREAVNYQRERKTRFLNEIATSGDLEEADTYVF
jgi:hypothetical protein